MSCETYGRIRGSNGSYCAECGDTLLEWYAYCPTCGEPLTQPEPLTLEQLKQMDGKPAYIRCGSGLEGWAVLAVEGETIYLYSPDFEDDNEPDIDFYGMWYDLDPDGHFGLHILGWIAYNRQPKDIGRGDGD